MQALLTIINRKPKNTVTYLHAIIEALKIVFADGRWWITDPAFSKVMPEEMISPQYLASRAKLFDSSRAQDYSYGQSGPSPAHNHIDYTGAVVWSDGSDQRLPLTLSSRYSLS